MTAQKPIRIRGVEYSSQKQAAAAIGVRPDTIASAKSRGRLDSVGLGLVGNPKRCRVAGVDYASVNEAASALGLSAWQVTGYLAVLAALEPPK